MNADTTTLAIPAALQTVSPGQIIELDVRPVIAGGKDPLQLIMQAVRTLEPRQVLKVVNTFEPTPLIRLLGNQGYSSYVELIREDLIQTYFYRQTDGEVPVPQKDPQLADAWEVVYQRFSGKLETVDVRRLAMPLPMHTILDALEALPADKALFVYHKKIPVFLLPELAERGFNYLIRELSQQEVHLLIYKATHA